MKYTNAFGIVFCVYRTKVSTSRIKFSIPSNLSKNTLYAQMDHSLLSEGHLQVLHKEKYRLTVDTIRFRISCKKSAIEP